MFVVGCAGYVFCVCVEYVCHSFRIMHSCVGTDYDSHSPSVKSTTPSKKATTAKKATPSKKTTYSNKGTPTNGKQPAADEDEEGDAYDIDMEEADEDEDEDEEGDADEGDAVDAMAGMSSPPVQAPARRKSSRRTG